MRYIKLILIALLVIVSTLFVLTTLDRHFSGSRVPPTISCDGEQIAVSVSDPEEVYLTGVTASDAQDGDLTHRIRIQGISKLITDNTAKITYIVFDSHGNSATCSRMIRYTDYSKPHFSVDTPLIYTEKETIQLLDRIRATDSVDGDITRDIRVSALAGTSDPDVYTVTVQVTNSLGDTSRLELPIVVHTGLIVRPDVILSDYLVYLPQGTVFRAESYLVGVETPIGPGDLKNVLITGNVDTSEPGTYYVYYRYPYSVTSGLSVLTVVVQ
jgi:hypothetical protein